MEKIIYKKTLIAIRFKKFKEGAIPLTDPREPLQLLVHKRPAGKYTKAHLHVPKKRTTEKLQECLVVMKGKIKINLYGPDKKFFKHIYLSVGEVIIFMDGGHAVQLLKDSEIIEIKNGPFIEDRMEIEHE
jgi:hypothetical protein